MSPFLVDPNNPTTVIGYRPPSSWPTLNFGSRDREAAAAYQEASEELAHPIFLLDDFQKGALLAVGARISTNENPHRGPVGKVIIATGAQVELAKKVIAMRSQRELKAKNALDGATGG